MRAGSGSHDASRRTSRRDFVEEIAGPQFALENGRDRGVQQSFDLAKDVDRYGQAQDRRQLAALEVAQHLQGIGRNTRSSECRMQAFGTDHPSRHRRKPVSIRPDLRATLKADRELGAETHGIQQMELVPACNHLARDRAVRGVERGETLGQQDEGIVTVGAPLAEAIGELDEVPCLSGGVQVVAQPQMRILDRHLGHHVKGAADRQHELHVAERFEPATETRAGTTNPLGDDPQLSQARGEDGQDPIGLAEIHAAQDDRLRLVEASARAHWVGYPWAVDIRTEFNDLLTEIEGEMQAVLSERDGHARPLYEMLAYHLGLDQPEGPRGKRIRPLLGLLAYQSLTGNHKDALPGAAAVELGHNFSLVHDDIEDSDRERRHRPTLWAIWGVPLAINAGDALFALSRLALYRLMEAPGYEPQKLLDLMRIYDETCLALCEGQYLDITFERRVDITVDEYLEMIGKKTASLLSASVQTGAMLASDDPEVVEAYRRFGYTLGIAFQMADDLKGTFWTSADSGKASAGDVRKRKKTLPLVWALSHAPEADAARLRQLYSPQDSVDGTGSDGIVPMTPDEVDEVLAILERCGAREHGIGQVRELRAQVLRDVGGLPIPPEVKAQLSGLVESVIAT
jgi:geranylgeranyl diphosphate synthase type I